jgi:hypothetical protein
MELVYPSWRYHAELEARIVYSAEEDAALGDGWCHSPADIVVVIPEPPKPEPICKFEELISSKPKRASRRIKT